MKRLNQVLEYAIALLIAAMAAGCFWQIFTRFVLNNPSQWTEEFLRYALVWLTLLGVPYAYGKEQHISIGFITSTFTKKGTVKDKIFIEILVLFLSVFVMIAGGIMVSINAAGQTSPALHIPMQFYYIGIPICGSLMVIYSIPRLMGFVKKYKKMKKEEK